MIVLKNVYKSYQITQKEKGIYGAVKSLFSPTKIKKEAVNDISFTIYKGEIVGYIGANGAGKSTTIKMMTGILTPDKGSITVNGIVPHENRIQNAKNIGVVFGQRTQLNWDIPVRESFYLLSKIYNIEKGLYEHNLNFLVEELELEGLLALPVRQMSLGQKMRCELAAAFLHNPQIVYLDEPTIGLDVDIKDRIRKFVKCVNEKYNTTIILTTHDMQDIEELCSRIIIIDRGCILYDGTIENLKKSYASEPKIIFECKDEFIDTPNIPEATNVEKKKGKIIVYYDIHSTTSKKIIENVIKNIDVNEIYIKEPTIESIVQKIYRKEITI